MPSAITLTETVKKISELSIPGVKTMRKSAPSSVSSAMLPLGYIRNAVIQKDQRSLSFQGGLRVVTCELVILIDPSRQGTVEDLYNFTRQIADDVAIALDDNAATLRLDDYTVKEDFEGVEANSYFIVSAIIRCA